MTDTSNSKNVDSLPTSDDEIEGQTNIYIENIEEKLITLYHNLINISPNNLNQCAVNCSNFMFLNPKKI